MSKRMFGVMCVVALLMGLSSVAEAIPVADGGSILNDFEAVDRWQVKPSGFRNCPGLAYVPPEGTEQDGSLYAVCRYPAAPYRQLTKLSLPVPQVGVTKATTIGARTDVSASNYSGVAYDPLYNGGTVLMLRGTYLPGSAGFVGGTDGVCITAEGDGSDIVLNTPAGGGAYARSSNEVCYVPGKYTWTNQDGYFIPCMGSGSYKNVRQYEVDTSSDPDTLVPSVLPGRTPGEYTQCAVFWLSELGLTDRIRGAEFVEYPNGTGVLYLTIGEYPQSATGDYGFIALTPGADGKFGANGVGVNDDEATGYFFGEASEGNSYSLQRQNITSEAGGAGNPDEELDIDGTYNSGYWAIAVDPTTGLIYVHGAYDYATGLVLRDTSFRTAAPAPIPEPAGLGLLGLALLAIRKRRS